MQTTHNVKLLKNVHSKICHYYKNQNVLVTGGTGFLGKILIEKLLRSTDVSKIFVLMRPHSGRNIEKTADEFLNLPLFEVLKSEKPCFKDRVLPICGDCTKPNLGLSTKIHQELVTSVNTVFHLAATVRFDENIKLALDVNVKGTQNVLSLCKKIQDLKSFVVASTAYSNCPRYDIDEIIYDFPVPYEDLENKLKSCSYEEAEKITPGLLNPWPNTYSFTKALSEFQIKTNAGNLPVGIFRPAIITSTYKEPIPDWVDSMGGAGTVIGFTSLGIAKVFPYDSQKNSECVPADLVAAALIAIGWDVSERKDLPVYNYVSSVDNPVKTSEFLKICRWHFCEYPLKRAKSAPKLILVENLFLYNILSLWYHYLPAILKDLKSVMLLKKPKNLIIMRQTDKIYRMFFYFMKRNWKFKNDNIKNLWNKMNDEDKKLFPFDITQVHWLQHFRGYVKGLRLYFFKDPLSTIQDAKKRMRRSEITQKTIIALTFFAAANSLGFVLLEII